MYGISLSSPTYATGVQHTTISLQLVAQFTGEIRNMSNHVILQDSIYRTTGTNQTIELISTIPVTYELTGALLSSATGTLQGGIPENLSITLSNGDGLKQIIGLYLSVDRRNDFMELPVNLTYGLDTTSPPLTASFSGPTKKIPGYDNIEFSRDSVIDTGVGVAYYSIQLSRSNLFTNAIEFTTTGTQLILAAGSLMQGPWYRRRGAVDKLGNTIYSIPTEFAIGGGSSQTIMGLGKDTVDPIATPTPLSDQCPSGDHSGNYFDGICTSFLEPPMLINIPLEHQSADYLPRREKIFNKLTEPKINPHFYVFPNYEAPKSLTIYEHSPTYVYNDIYEHTKPTKTYPQLPYQPSFGVKKSPPLEGSSANFISKFSGISTSRNTSYLFYRFVQTSNSCSDVGQFCPQDPVCWDVGSLCYNERNECNEGLYAEILGIN